ncbi:hypothetical protein LWI28_019439 [Acer negundo]|uniref:Alcohol dehydrogenase-like N-terminal domain-containing protein n=1 Tax=Acer negundo TaxID=4023 RepID=A0AAD5NLZ4_ACENE|nr:hypothetical protein LWI28_019439 [Acer negundo]
MKDLADELVQPKEAFGWAARDTSGVLSPFTFSRRATGEKDVSFKVLYCGICHSDVHMLKNDWGFSTYPLIPGLDLMAVDRSPPRSESVKLPEHGHYGWRKIGGGG